MSLSSEHYQTVLNCENLSLYCVGINWLDPYPFEIRSHPR